MGEILFANWMGRVSEQDDLAARGPIERLGALLDHEPGWSAAAVPPLGHWLYFNPNARASELGPDGHLALAADPLIPSFGLPRRMWAGGRLTFVGPMTYGSKLCRRSTTQSIERKHGASGEMVFVTLRHEVSAAGEPCLIEEQDLVYRAVAPAVSQAPGPTASSASATATSSRSHQLGPVELFRYSALTFNAHRIHYDLPYATGEEGYPGLVAHGPLVATLLLDHYRRDWPGAEIKAFSFRARKPLFANRPFTVNALARADGADLWAENDEGEVTMTATVSIS